ncbi:uncharacterized protein LOC112905625 [Agrilus planipennis]|uniref:Uncharacterized protein LOC112905625 n=1 Tax=Agrilus planipennis TaxID=224129 RepID=A0A7F5RE44_AGRPL|nr:uncharacterized protein LOC112905625 [Agrilus planipennis]
MFAMFRLLCFSIIVAVANSANIFAIFSVPSISHQLVFQPIWRELSLRGHKVTVVTPNPLNDPTLTNLTEIDVSYVYGTVSLQFLIDNSNLMPDQLVSMSVDHYVKPLIESQLNHSDVMKILKDNNSHFDLVISEMICSPAFGFAYKFNAPLVGMLSFSDLSAAFLAIGNPLHPILNPDMLLGYGKQLSFWQRVCQHIHRSATFYERDICKIRRTKGAMVTKKEKRRMIGNIFRLQGLIVRYI